MFWSSRPRSPVTEADQAWLLLAIPDLLRVLGAARLLALPTWTPNTRDFPHEFTGGEGDAEFVLDHVCKVMDTPRAAIELRYFDDGTMDMGGGLQVTSADRKGWSQGSAGFYQQDRGGRSAITLNAKRLGNAQGLIATLAHEVAHVKLLGERRLDPADPEQELYTDLTVIVHGYGIFQGNAAFSFNQWQGDGHQGWSTSRTGYLPLEVIGFAFALLTAMKKEEPDWLRYLSASFAPHFRKSLAFIHAEPSVLDQALRNLAEETQDPGPEEVR